MDKETATTTPPGVVVAAVERARGRQALPIAWDTRPAAAGGQRWFHLNPNEPIPPGDLLHWTGISGNWNHQCAACHSTNVRKGYEAAGDRDDTTWSEIDVACEACHGPGSNHVAWAQAGARKDGGWHGPGRGPRRARRRALG